MKTKLLLNTAFFLSLFCEWSGIANAQTNFLWAKQFSGTNYSQGVGIAVDASGNVYTTGSFGGTTDFDPGAGVFNMTPSGGSWDNDVYICKMDASGNFVWAKQLGGANYDGVISIGVDAAGNVYTAGTFSGPADYDPGSGTFTLTPFGGSWDQDIFISKLDASGNFVWAKQIGSPNYDQIGGMTVDAAGNVYTTGGFSNTEDFDPNAGIYNLTPYGGTWDQDVFVSKLDASGSFVWAKQLGGTNYDVPGGISVDAAGNVFTTGGFYGTADFDPGAGLDTITPVFSEYGYPSEDIFISKLNASGDHVWAKSMGGPSYEQGTVITTYSNGDVYSAGTFSGSADFDPGAGAYTLTPIGGDYASNIYISKLHPTGVFEWVMQFAGGNYNYVSSIAVDAFRNVYTTGGYEGTTDFNPGSEVYNLTTPSEYNQDGFISKLDGAGYFVWANRIGGDNYDQSTAIALDQAGNVYTTGYFGDTVDFDPGAGVFDMSVTEEYTNNSYVLKLHNSNVGVEEQSAATTSEFAVYPNPNNGLFNLTMDLQSEEKLTVDIVNIEGQLLKTINQSRLNAGISTITIDASDLSNGIYFVKISNETIHKTMKIIINK